MSSVSKLDKEKTKLVQEKCQLILGQMLRDEDNKFCVDCDAKGPRWASWNLGIFLCIRCAGIHRNLGVHISRVKSVNLDSWTPEQVVTLQQMGNSRARAVYEANLPDNFRRPQTDSTLESFIRAKYEHKKYIAREWVPPAPVRVSWDAEIEFELKQKKEAKRKATNTSSGAGVSLPAPVAAKSTTSAPKVEASAQPKETTAVPSSITSLSQDLLGLDISSSAVTNDNDIFGALLSGPQVISTVNGAPSVAPAAAAAAAASVIGGSEAVPDTRSADEDSFFNQKLPAANQKKTLDKDSILALYNQGGSNSMSTAMFGQPTLYGNHQPPYNPSGVAAPAPVLPNQVAQGGLFNNQVFASGAYGVQPNPPMTQQLAGLSLGATPSYVHPAISQMAPNLVPGMAFPRPTTAAPTLPASQLNAALNGQALPPNFWN